jgi:predicted GIY-YIG superfamily endonuclease
MYVYLLKSLRFPSRKYIGITDNLKIRLNEHNTGKSKHTSKYIPWKIVSATWFENREKAEEFEIFLKHGSGHAFAKKHFW